MNHPFLFPTSGDEWQNWVSNEGASILAIIIALVIVWAIARFIVLHLLRHLVRGAAEVRRQDPEMAERRMRTLISATDWIIGVVLVFVGVVLILGKLGLNVSAVIASAGIAGLALTLGAQAFVKDLINGTFILAENQYQVGDLVKVANISGEVIALNPRRTVLRDDDGNVHTIPNGTITVATNMTRDFSRINLDIGVTYDDDVDKAISLINGECENLLAAHKDDFLTAPKVTRVDNLTDPSVQLKVSADVRIYTQWALMAELRMRVNARLAEAGIETAYARRPVEDGAQAEPSK